MMFQAYLLVDIGNTLTKWAIAHLPDSRRPTNRIELPTVAGEMPTDEVTSESIRALKQQFPGYYLILASVVPRLTPLFQRTFKRAIHIVNGDSSALGFSFDYPQPSELGADRLAAAVAAHADGKWPVIVVSSGTATAFTVLDKEGKLCGGVIAPGLHTQLAALIGGTAQLPDLALRPPRAFLARSTEEAIRAGVFLSFQGGVRETLRHLSAALPGRRPRLILTGGHAPHLSDSLEVRHTLRPLLVFEGLRIIGSRLLTETLKRGNRL